MFIPEELTTRFDFCVPEAKWPSDLVGVQNGLEAVARICMRVKNDASNFKFGPGVNFMAMLDERILTAD